MKQDYIEDGDSAFSDQLLVFKDAVGPYVPTLGLTPAQVASQAGDANYFANLIATQTVIQNAASQWTTWKGLIRDGGSPPPTGAPVAPVLPAAVPVVAPGIEARFRALVRLIKALPTYNPSIGDALGIEGEEKGGPDFDALKPEITASVGGQVKIGWGWQGHSGELDLIEIHVDRGSGYGLLTYDSTPNYFDTAAFPAAPAKWTYKAIYRVGDSQVGQWSAEVSVTVGG